MPPWIFQVSKRVKCLNCPGKCTNQFVCLELLVSKKNRGAASVGE